MKIGEIPISNIFHLCAVASYIEEEAHKMLEELKHLKGGSDVDCLIDKLRGHYYEIETTLDDEIYKLEEMVYERKKGGTK